MEKARNLPTELIELIFNQIDPTDRSTCVAVSLTNKLAYRAITPYLYRTVGISEEVLGHRHRQQRLHLLVRTLFENPRLASHVRTIRQDLFSGMGNELSHVLYGQDFTLEGFEKKLRVELGLRTTTGIGAFLCKLLAKRQLCSAWHFFVLLLLCPNVEDLVLTGKSSVMKSYNLFDDLVHASVTTSKPCGLQKVRFASLRQTFSEGPATIADAMVLLQLPKLDELSVATLEKCAYPTILLHSTLREDFQSSLRNISLLDFKSTEDELAILLSSCDRLEGLAIDWSPSTASVGTFTELSWRLAATAFELQHLRLECDSASQEDVLSRNLNAPFDERARRCSMFQPVDSLVGLYRLRHLVISKNLLFGTTLFKRLTLRDILPSSLEKLTLISPAYLLMERDSALLGCEELKNIQVEIVDGSKLSQGCGPWMTK